MLLAESLHILETGKEAYTLAVDYSISSRLTRLACTYNERSVVLICVESNGIIFIIVKISVICGSIISPPSKKSAKFLSNLNSILIFAAKYSNQTILLIN